MLKFCLICIIGLGLVVGFPNSKENDGVTAHLAANQQRGGGRHSKTRRSVEDDEYADEYEDVCLTSEQSEDPETECVFPFTFNNFTYNGCPSDPLDDTKRWCSTKTDGIHTSDSDSWGYCTSGCYPEIFPDELLISADANNDTQTETCDYTACNGFAFKIDVFDKVETFGQCQFPAGENGNKDDYFCFVNKDSACEDKAQYGDEEDGLFITTLACLDPKTPLPRGFSFRNSFSRGFSASNRQSSGSRGRYSYGSNRYSTGGNHGFYRPIRQRPRYPRASIGTATNNAGTATVDYSRGCRTVGGNRPNRRCVFPFKFNGVTYNTCTKDSSKFTGGKAWCSTSTDSYGRHRSGTWGTCGSNCPKSGSGSSVGASIGSNQPSKPVCRSRYTSGDWCAKLYSGNYQNGKVQEISDSEAGFTSISCDVSSLELKDKCMLKLFSDDEGLLLDAFNVSSINNFNQITQVTEVQCSCFPDKCPRGYGCKSDATKALNNAGTALVTYNQRAGRYRQNCTWKPRKFGRWRCVKNQNRWGRSLRGKKNDS